MRALLKLQTVFFEKEIVYAHGGDSLFISGDIDNILDYDNFFKGVVYADKGSCFLSQLFFCVQAEGRLDIVTLTAQTCNETAV